MTSLVVIEKDDLFINSFAIANGVKYSHSSIIKSIRRNEDDLKYFGALRLSVQKTKGRPAEYYTLNESQFYFLITLLDNNEEVVKFKKAIVKEFMRMRKTLLNIKVMQQSEEWKQARIDGKAVRRETTDAIQDFVEYAVKQGSTSAVRYYANITKMENKALFILEQKFDNIREVLNNHQLSTLKIADRIVYESLQEGMERSMHYKEIFQLAKQRVETLATLVKPTIVISMTEVKLLNDVEEEHND